MKKILLIEDHPEIRENTAEILQLAGYEVFTAENGKIGVEQARSVLPDLILCDIMMPVLDGFGVLHMLQRDTQLQNVPFIFLTAKSERSDHRKAMELGADDFVSKPFTEMELLTAIEARLAKVSHLQLALQARLGGMKERKAWAAKLFESTDPHVFHARKRTMLFQEGNLAQQLLRVEKGIVKTFCTNSFGKVLITGLYFPGELVGLPDMLTAKTYTISAEAVTECDISVVALHDFQQYLEQNPKENESLVPFLTTELVQSQSQLLDMAYTPMRDRVENLMQMLQDRLSENQLGKAEQYFTREELAQMAGTATESLIRVLAGKQ